MNNVSLNTFAEEQAALVFSGGQYLFRWREHDAVQSKFISPASVRAAFSAEPIDTGWLPPNVRRWGTGANGNWAVLSIPPMRRQLLFEHIVQDIPTMTLDVPLPALVFMRIGSSGYIWALKDEFAPDAVLYHAPLPNVNSSGAICFGSNRLEGQSVAQSWQLFLDSPFTSHQVNGKSRRQPDDIRLLLASLHKKRRYPLRDLLPLQPRVTVDQAIAALTRAQPNRYINED
jgi:PRTRC genetic system protein B